MDGARGHGENLFLGVLAGLIAAGAGAFIWMGVTLATGPHAGFVALALGALVGLTIRYAGNGNSMIFGIIGGVLTLAGCVAGEVLTRAQLMVTPECDFYNTLATLDWTQVLGDIFNRTDPIMYLIYAIGIFESYLFAIRK